MCLLLNKIEFAVFNIKNNTERYCTLVSVEEIVKTKQLMKEQDFRVQETLNLCKSFLEYIDNVSLTKLQNSAIVLWTNFWNIKFQVENVKNTPTESSVKSKYSSKSSKSWFSSPNTSMKSNKSLLNYFTTLRKVKHLLRKLESN